MILGTKRLGLSKNTQGFSLGTLLYFEGATPSYKKQQSEKLHMTEKVLLHWNTHPFLCDFGHEGVNIRRYSRVLTEYPPVFRRGNPKLQETVKKKSFMWQKKIQQHWHIIYLVFCVILAMKGFISVNAHLLYFEEATQATRKS